MLQQPKKLELELTPIEQETKMAYITHIECLGIEKDEAKTLPTLTQLKFGLLPEWAVEKINSAVLLQLNIWVRQILGAETLHNLFTGD